MEFFKSLTKINCYFLLFIIVFVIRNVLEFNRGVRFKMGIPKKGKITMVPLFIMYIIVGLLCCTDLYMRRNINIILYSCGLGLYITAFTLREIASWQMKKSYTNEINPNGMLMVDDGFFKLIRHPLYLFYILELIALTLITVNIINAVLTLAFIILILIRIRAEERFLLLTYGKPYSDYRKKTKKLIPFIL